MHIIIKISCKNFAPSKLAKAMDFVTSTKYIYVLIRRSATHTQTSKVRISRNLEKPVYCIFIIHLTISFYTQNRNGRIGQFIDSLLHSELISTILIEFITNEIKSTWHHYLLLTIYFTLISWLYNNRHQHSVVCPGFYACKLGWLHGRVKRWFCQNDSVVLSVLAHILLLYSCNVLLDFVHQPTIHLQLAAARNLESQPMSFIMTIDSSLTISACSLACQHFAEGF